MIVSHARHPDLIGLRPSRVCVIKPSALGDVVNAFAALSALHSLWPGTEFTWVINASLRGLVDGHPEVNRVIAYDRAGVGLRRGGIAKLASFLRHLQGEHFDVAIDLQGLLRSGLMTAATRAPVRVGLADAREGAPWFYTHRVAPPGTIDQAHAVDRVLSVARAFGADVSRPRSVVAAKDEDHAWAEGVLAGLGRPRLVVNLGARWETKQWPPGHFAEVARRAVAERGASLVAIGAPEDRPFVNEFLARLGPDAIRVLDLCGRTTLPQIAALARRCEVLLSNDTGPLHLAAAAGTRVVGVYTCTLAALNGPYGPLALTAETNVSCKGSYKVACPNHLECMAELTPDRVWPLVAAQLDAAWAGSRPEAETAA